MQSSTSNTYPMNSWDESITSPPATVENRCWGSGLNDSVPYYGINPCHNLHQHRNQRPKHLSSRNPSRKRTTLPTIRVQADESAKLAPCLARFMHLCRNGSNDGWRYNPQLS